jgi:hypothetical protein
MRRSALSVRRGIAASLWIFAAALAGCGPAAETAAPERVAAAVPQGASQSGMKATELPGFTLDLPAGEVTSQVGAPEAGAHTQRVGAAELRVLWQATHNTVADLPVLREVLAGTTTAQVQAVPLQRADGVLDIVAGKARAAAYAVVVCPGGFTVTIVHTAPLAELAKLQATAPRIVESVRCKPESARLQPPQFAIVPPGGFGRIEGSGDAYRSLEGDRLAFSSVQMDTTRGPPERIAEYVRNLGATTWGLPADQVGVSEDAAFGAADDGRQLLRVQRTGTDAAFYHYAHYCPALQITLMARIEPGDGKDLRAAELANRLQCPDGALPRLPGVDAVFGAACEAGDDKACRRWRDLAAAGEAAGPTPAR